MNRTSLLRKVSRTVLPFGPCSICGNDSRCGPAPGICSACWREREKIEGPVCPICGKLLTHGIDKDDQVCGTCLTDPPPWRNSTSVYLYRGPVRNLILMYKEGKRYALAPLFSRALCAKIRGRWPDETWDEVTCIPGLIKKRITRGFTPASLIAQGVADKLELPFLKRLKMKKSVKPQKVLSAKKRRENLRGAFALRPIEQTLKDRKLLLIDDVVTTGSTIREGASILKRAGAEVWVATFAMTPLRKLDMVGAEDSDRKEGADDG